MIKNCLICDKAYRRKPSQIAKSKYCSRECYHTSTLGKPSWNKGNPLSKKHRDNLSKATTRAWEEGRHDNNPTSSGKPAWNRGKRCLSSRGANNGNWKGGISKLVNNIRRCDKYKKWSRRVLERDDFTCDRCALRGVRLEVHHIYSFSNIMTDYNIQSYSNAISCDDLWDLENGQTLCVDCHKEVTYAR